MKNKEIVKKLKEELKHAEYYNEMSPFAIYDTDDVKQLKERMGLLENTEVNYDELPVDACKNCKSLHIVDDDDQNAICMRCNSINELVSFANIHEYKKNSNIWNED